MRPWGRDGSVRVIGVVHLAPLPGSPRGEAGLDDVLRRAEADAAALAAGGVDGIIVENFGDAPFERGRVDAACVAMMTRAALAVRQAAPEVVLGVNVLRNDGAAAIAVAAAVGAALVRVNVLVGAMVTDQGVIEGIARDVAVERRRLAPGLAVAADVLVKHATPLGAPRRADVARDTWHRGGADALIVSGAGTGLATDPAAIDEVREAVPEAPVWVGSGVTPATADALRGRVDAAIVGTWLHAGGQWAAPVDAERVRALVGLLRG